jgi:AraC-like DNA-binding protein
MENKLQISVGEDIYRRLWRARLLIDSSFDRPLNLDEISSEACFSRYRFTR